MNKKILALSVAAAIGGISTSASAALTFNADGVGHILIQPYFTAQEGNSTLINLVNTDTVRGKAVKVRFRSAGNSDDVLDFQVFLSPGDVWTANVSEGADGKAVLSTADKTCTVPAIPAGGVSFITNNLPPSATDAEKATWTREGYVEFLNMGDIVKDADTTTAAYKLYATTKHVAGVAPCDTAILNDPTKVEPGLSAPTSGLMGNWTIINVPSAASWAGESAALVSAGAPTNVVYFPQDSNQYFPAVSVNMHTADPLLIKADKVANFDLPDLSTPYDGDYANATAQAAALTTALAVSSVTNEFLTNAAIAAETDWVFSMPTRRYHVAYDYATTVAAEKRVFNVAGAAVTTAPVASWFYSSNTEVSGNLICVKLGGVTNFDQEEGTATAGVVFSPGTIETVKFCGEGTVVKFNGSNVLGASVASGSLSTGSTAGWTTINTANGGFGLPVLGQSFVQATNSAVAAGVSGNFGAGWAHRVTRP
ncbi:hypothetical protein J5J83_14045 [Azoarcus sp. L1K30]|uniref:hypothetical protein n=1 Tax=Azoarcus sp. L1K30 TaxID=2820277 RepID=UPI001B83382D|nr:hypothetical protein [Azoarcus sp. L1K30]MBR0567241.1 hypothetical protein [Azoarcus sp. L1K30]